MKNALVIGGNGFIGSHLVDTLLYYKWAITVIDESPRKFGDIPDSINFINEKLYQSLYNINKIINKIKPDVIFYLAWRTFPETSMRNSPNDVGVNIIPLINIIKICSTLRIKIIFISSGGAIYGNCNQLPIPESAHTNPISPYGIEKLMAEKYLYMYHELNELDYIIIRPSTPFGPFQNYLGSQGAVTIFMYRVSKNLPITLWGDGKIIRDYFYVSNLIDAIIKCTDYETYGDKRIFNVGGGIGISINQLIYKIESTVNSKAIIIKNNARKFDPKSVVLDTTLIHNELGWIPKVSLDEGLNKTWHWLSKL